MDGREGDSPMAGKKEAHRTVQDADGLDPAAASGHGDDPGEGRGEGSDHAADSGNGQEGDKPGEPVEIDLGRFLAEYEKLRQDHEALTRMYDEMKDARLRLQAEFDNFRRRTREEDARRKQEALEGVVRDLLPIVDNMERAAGAADIGRDQPGGTPDGSGQGEPDGDAGIREGVALILQQLRGLLEARGVTPAPGVGEPFDPRWHHAVGMVEAGTGAGEDGDEVGSDEGAAADTDEAGAAESDEGDATPVVIEEFQKGYVLGGRAIRPSLVTVGPRSALPGGSEIRKGNER